MACSLFSMKPKADSTKSVPNSLPKWLEVVHDRVAEVRFGTVQIVIHEGRVTPVESTPTPRLPLDSSR